MTGGTIERERERAGEGGRGRESHQGMTEHRFVFLFSTGDRPDLLLSV